LVGKEKAINADCVHIGRAQVGTITSGMISPTLNKNIALCRVDVKYSEMGTEVEVGKIDGHQKRIKAKVVRFPFYDPDKTRVKA
jgi:aminomethyltransferase